MIGRIKYMDKVYSFRRFYLQNKTLSLEDIRIKLYQLDSSYVNTKAEVSLREYKNKEFRKILGKVDLLEDGVFILNSSLYTIRYRFYELYFYLVRLINNTHIDDEECSYAFKRCIVRINQSIRNCNSTKEFKIPLIQENINISNIKRIRSICDNDQDVIHSITLLTTLPKIALPYNSVMNIPYYHSTY